MADKWSDFVKEDQARPASPSGQITASSHPKMEDDSWKLWTPQGTPSSGPIEPTEGSPVGRFLSGAWDVAKGAAGGIGSAINAASSPNPYDKMQAGMQLIQPHVDQAKKAKEAWEQGSPVEAAGHAVAAAVPIVGPAAAHAGERMGGSQPKYDKYGGVVEQGHAPDVAGGLGEATALTALSSPENTRSGKVASAPVRAVQSMMKVDPDVGLYQAMPFRVKTEDFTRMAPTVRGDIKLAAQDPIVDIPSLKRAVGAAKAVNRAVFDMHLDPARQAGIQYPGNPIADAMESGIPPSLKIEARTNPAAQAQIDQIRQTAAAYRRGFTVDELRDLAVETNGDINAFHHKSADAQNAALASKGGIAGLEAKAGAIRQIFRDNFGPDAADIQRRWGWLDDVDAAAEAQHGRVLKSETPVSGAVKLQRMAGAPGKAMHGDVEGALNASGKTNSLIKRVFEQTDPGMPLPTPQGGQGVGAIPQAIPPSRQLPPGTPQLAAQSPTGSVSGGGMPPGMQQNVWQNINGQRALPAGTAPFTQGTSVPDVLGRPDLRTGYRGGLLEAGPQPPVGGPHEAGQVRVGQSPPKIEMPDRSFVRSIPGKYPEKIDTNAPGFGEMPSDETIAQRLSKAILGGNQ